MSSTDSDDHRPEGSDADEQRGFSRQEELYSQEEVLFAPDHARDANPFARIWSLMPRIMPYFRPHRLKGVGAVVTTALLALLALAQPWPLAFVVDGVLASEGVPGWVTMIAGESAGQLILFGVVATIGITLATGVVSMANQYLTVMIQERMSLDFRSDLFEHMQRLSLAFHEDSRTGMMMYRLSSQAKAIGQLVVALPQVGQSVLTLLGMLYLAYRLNAPLALVALGVLPFIYYSISFYMARVEPQLMRVRGMEGTNFSIVHEALTMLPVIRAFGRERHEFERFRDQGERTIDARIDLTVRQTLFRLGVNLIIAIGTAAVLGVGAHQVLDGSLSVGELLVVLSYVAAVYQPLEQLTGIVASFQQFSIGVDHSLRIMDIEPDVTETDDPRPLGRAQGRIVFENVSFDYPTSPGALKDISFTVEAGESLAIVGPTGAGKSTLVSLMPRFFDPTSGRVLLDDADCRDYAIADLRHQFSMVLQEPLLFAGTIKDNIAYGRLDADSKAVREAAKKANAHAFIAGLPDGYRTSLGERGSKVSGGERQRISVARAFLRDAPILILDEPTSAIDSRTEEVILDALERLMEGRTTVVIAHRLSTLRNVDKVLVLDRGRAVQFGTHDDLVAQEGLYRQLWTTQTGQALLDAETTAGPTEEPAASTEEPAASTEEPALSVHDDRAHVATGGPGGSVTVVAVGRASFDGAEILLGLSDAQRRRPEAIAHAMVIRNGEVTAHGGHDRLLAEGGTYRDFWTHTLTELDRRRREGARSTNGASPPEAEPDRRVTALEQAAAQARENPPPPAEADVAVSRRAARGHDVIVASGAGPSGPAEHVLYGAVLLGGELVDCGTHDELLERCHPYRSAWGDASVGDGDGGAGPLPSELDLVPLSRRPLVLPRRTLDLLRSRPLPARSPAPERRPDISIVMPVLDKLDLTRLSLESVLTAPTTAAYEIVVVDNGSGDETRTYLEALGSSRGEVRLIRNETNLGFATASNQGLEAARGEVLILLNNDTLVTERWMDRLAMHAGLPGVGLVSPATNRCGNEAEVAVTYRTYGELAQHAAARARSRAGRSFPLPMAVMFCTAMRREVYERVGPLDTRFEIGMFEDDDYARRVRDHGLRIICAEDVFVHHFGEGSFGDLVASGTRSRLFSENRRRYEEKWGAPWAPHGRSVDRSYESLVERVSDTVRAATPPDSEVLIISKGDDVLVDRSGTRARHFPQGPDGQWAGYYPADDGAAIEHLEELKSRGATHLVVPHSAAWWLTCYEGFRRHLEDQYELVAEAPDIARVYALTTETT